MTMDSEQNLVGRLMGAGKQLLQKMGVYTPPAAKDAYLPPAAQSSTDTPRLPWSIYDLREFYRKQSPVEGKDEQGKA